MAEIKPYEHLLGVVSDIRERCNFHPYSDFIITLQNGLRVKKVRLSLPNSLEENSELSRLLKRFVIENKKQLIGKKIYCKYHPKPNPKDTNQFFDIVEFEDVKTEKEYEIEKAILDFYKSDSHGIIGINRLITTITLAIPAADATIPKYKGGALIKFGKEGIASPVCTIDANNFYSNIVIANKFNPKNDKEGIFLKIIENLAKIRQSNQLLGEYLTDQSKLKIITESLIGSLNNKEFIFYDSELYGRIIKEGRRILEKVLVLINNISKDFTNEGKFLEVIRVHTDGIDLKVRTEWCKNDIISKINNLLCQTESPYYQFRYDGYYMKGLFKNVNNFVLWTKDRPVKVGGIFFKGFENLIASYFEGVYSDNFSRYEQIKEILLKKPDRRLYKVLNFLEGNKYISGKKR